MPLPAHLLEQIRALRRSTSEWFSIEQIKKRDKDLEIAARYIQKGSDKELVVRRNGQELYAQLDKWAGRLLENEVRSYEDKVWRLYSENLFVPNAEDDVSLQKEFTQYINDSADAISAEISRFSDYVPPSRSYHDVSSDVKRTVRSLTSELAVTTQLGGELLRLESIDRSPDALGRIAYGQIKIERFFSHNYAEIHHPFQAENKLQIPVERLQRAIRFLTYVIFSESDAPRLKGFDQKFINIFLRYLSCSRESAGAMATIAEQVSGLLEPFLKKVALMFFGDVKDENGTLLWHKGLEALIKGQALCSTDLNKTEEAYWITKSVSDAALRVSFRLRHVGTHEAHGNPPYENEKLACFAFAALLLASDILLESHAAIRKTVDLQGDSDAVRDLCVKIEELAIGPDGPRTEPPSAAPSNRLQKLLSAKSRVEAMWPSCSASLRGLLESEYVSVKGEIEESDREENIESYLESMRDDEYQ
jgi:hypothetical protein